MSICMLLALATVHSFLAFPQAMETAGPLTARIEGPAQIVPETVPGHIDVVLENSGETAIAGTVRVEGIDGWLVEPHGRVPFSVAPKSNARPKVGRGPSAPSARGLAHDDRELGLRRVVQRGEVPRGLKELVRRALPCAFLSRFIPSIVDVRPRLLTPIARLRRRVDRPASRRSRPRSAARAAQPPHAPLHPPSAALQS